VDPVSAQNYSSNTNRGSEIVDYFFVEASKSLHTATDKAVDNYCITCVQNFGGRKNHSIP